jgi:hypothetical protein
VLALAARGGVDVDEDEDEEERAALLARTRLLQTFESF